MKQYLAVDEAQTEASKGELMFANLAVISTAESYKARHINVHAFSLLHYNIRTGLGFA